MDIGVGVGSEEEDGFDVEGGEGGVGEGSEGGGVEVNMGGGTETSPKKVRYSLSLSM